MPGVASCDIYFWNTTYPNVVRFWSADHIHIIDDTDTRQPTLVPCRSTPVFIRASDYNKDAKEWIPQR
jgi:hypothetical protein